jgi:hypothetical protein
MTFRLQADTRLEQARLAEIIRYLQRLQDTGEIAWFARINSGVAGGSQRFVPFYRLWVPWAARPAPSGRRRQAQPWLQKGISDVLAMRTDGRLIAIEVKQPGNTVTAEQALFLDVVKAGGGIAAVVTSWRELGVLIGKPNPRGPNDA